jgi:hypothetical protein
MSTEFGKMPVGVCQNTKGSFELAELLEPSKWKKYVVETTATTVPIRRELVPTVSEGNPRSLR